MPRPAVALTVAEDRHVAGVVGVVNGRAGVGVWQIEEDTDEAGARQLRHAVQPYLGLTEVLARRFGDLDCLRDEAAHRCGEPDRHEERALHVLVAEAGGDERVVGGVAPWREHGGEIGWQRLRVALLPLHPQAVDVDVDRPEDRVVRGGEVAEHVAVFRLRVHVVASVESAPGDSHTAVAMLRAGQGRDVRRICLGRLVIGVEAPRPEVHGVMRVLVEKAEGVVVEAAAAEVAEGTEREDLLDVLRRRIVVVHGLLDSSAAGVLRRVAEGIEKRVRREEGVDEAVAVQTLRELGVLGELGDVREEVAQPRVPEALVHHVLHERHAGGLRELRDGLVRQPGDGVFLQEGLVGLGDDPALLRLVGPVLRHGPVPVRHDRARRHVLQHLLELIEVDAVPRQEALPPVLAVVLVDQRHVVVAAAVLRPLVQPVELAEGGAEFLDLRFRQTIEVHALLEGAVLGTDLVRRAVVDLELARGLLDIPGLDHPQFRLGRLAGHGKRRAVIVGRAAVVDPVGDEGDVARGDGAPAPRQRREARAVERRLAAQPAHEA